MAITTVIGITVAQGATVLNAIISFIQYTLGLALVALLVNIISNIHSAITWSVIGRELHSSLWPTLLFTDSSNGASPRVAFMSWMGISSTILVAVAGVITPLGLKPGPFVASHNFRPMNAFYVGDNSPLASATSPRSNYFNSRPCNFLYYGPCPGDKDDVETTEISLRVFEQFNSTPYGPFNIQFRRYYRSKLLHTNDTSITKDKNISVIETQFSTLESLILRDGLFAVEGAIVDMSDTPGIGLTNHTMPYSLKDGGTWSQEMLWLEPATACIDTNLTIDYFLQDPNSIFIDYNLTDRGGFVNLATQTPQPDRGGQNLNLYHHAYAGAYFSNIVDMIVLNNITRNQSSIGKVFEFAGDTSTIKPGVVQFRSLDYLQGNSSDIVDVDADLNCSGYGGENTAGITMVGVSCGTYFGPPYRTDGGDDRLKDMGSAWRQNLYVCASATKASIQRVNYSIKGKNNLTALQITRSPIDQPVLWAAEKTDLFIRDVAIYWGQVADSYEFDANLATIRAKEFYIPASYADMDGVPVSGQAQTVLGAAWNTLYNDVNPMKLIAGLADYSGSTNAALLKKYQSIIASNPTQGAAHISNLIWTDIVANTLVGTDMSTVLTV